MFNTTKWNVGARSAGLAVALAVSVTYPGSVGATEAESFPADSPRWQLGPKATVTDYLGRRCIALEDDSATLKDFEMADGVIDVDMAGSGARGFYNISFRRQSNGEMELVYLRPHKTGLDDDLKTGIRQGGVGFYGVHVSNVEIRRMPPAVWVRNEPAMPPTTIVKWRLSPSMDALERDLERPLSKSEADSMKWQEVTAEPPGFVVINRYRKGPDVIPTFAKDFSKRLQPQKGMQLVYARTTVVSDRDQIKKLNIGYSDDISLFLNGRILYRGRSAQRFRDPGFLGIVNAENDAVYLPLKKGRNELVLAVSELTGGWGFICRFDDMNGIH